MIEGDAHNVFHLSMISSIHVSEKEKEGVFFVAVFSYQAATDRKFKQRKNFLGSSFLLHPLKVSLTS